MFFIGRRNCSSHHVPGYVQASKGQGDLIPFFSKKSYRPIITESHPKRNKGKGEGSAVAFYINIDELPWKIQGTYPERHEVERYVTTLVGHF